MNKPQRTFLSMMAIWLLISEVPMIYFGDWKFATDNALIFMTYLCLGIFLLMNNHERN